MSRRTVSLAADGLPKILQLEITPMLGMSGYQSLIKLYISQGLRKGLQKLPGSHVAVLAESLRKSGVKEADIAAAIKEAGLKTA